MQRIEHSDECGLIYQSTRQDRHRSSFRIVFVLNRHPTTIIRPILVQGASPTDHAGRVILLRISVVEDARKSYIPSGIDVGIVLGKVGMPCTPAKVLAAPLRELEGLQYGLEVGRASCSAPTTGSQ